MPFDQPEYRVPAASVSPVPSPARDPRFRCLLEAPIALTLIRLARPNVAVMLAQASTGLVETFWVSRLGADALAGMALVFPGFTMMQMLSAGAVGGGISSAIARALGGGRRDDANALVLHAIIIDLTLGLFFRSWWWRSAPRCTARSAARAARSRPHCNIRTSCSPARGWYG